jgi:hypothetical protein
MPPKRSKSKGNRTKGKREKKREISKRVTVKEKDKAFYSDYYPKNLLLVISTHGGICALEREGTKHIETFQIPDNIEYVAKVNLAPVGKIAAWSSINRGIQDKIIKQGLGDKYLKDYIKDTTISDFIDAIRTIQHNDEFVDIDEVEDTESLTAFTQTLQMRLEREYEEKMDRIISKGIRDDQSYLHGVKNSMSEGSTLHYYYNDDEPLEDDYVEEMEEIKIYPHVFPVGEPKTMVNKHFVTDNSMAETSSIDKHIGIIALNLKSGRDPNLVVDILQYLKRRSRSNSEPLRLTTKDIFKFISNIKRSDGTQAVKRVMIVDLSCSRFRFEDERIKGDIMRIGFGGKKTTLFK